LQNPDQSPLPTAHDQNRYEVDHPWGPHKTYILLLHLSPFAIFILNLLGYLVPLIMWLVKRDEHEAIDRHGREVLNFHLTLLLGYLGMTILLVLGMVFFVIGGFVLYFLAIFGMIVMAIFSIIVMIMAAIKVSEGKDYHYPLSIRFL
jgi:uncharacterized Tic20 family protein